MNIAISLSVTEHRFAMPLGHMYCVFSLNVIMSGIRDSGCFAVVKKTGSSVVTNYCLADFYVFMIFCFVLPFNRCK